MGQQCSSKISYSIVDDAQCYDIYISNDIIIIEVYSRKRSEHLKLQMLKTNNWLEIYEVLDKLCHNNSYMMNSVVGFLNKRPNIYLKIENLPTNNELHIPNKMSIFNKINENIFKIFTIKVDDIEWSNN